MLANSVFFNVTNFYLTPSIIWSLTYFYLLFYLVLIFSATVYLVSTINDFLAFNKYKNTTLFTLVSGPSIYNLLLTPCAILLFLNYSWLGPETLAWFGHIVFTPIQFKMLYLIIFNFCFVWLVYTTCFYFTSQEVYDFTIVTYSLCCWLILLFMSNNIFTLIFIIEILSTLVTLVLITSLFSSTSFYNNLNLTNTLYFNNLNPSSFLQTLLFFFWISLIASLNLFIFLILFYLQFFTFDWYLFDTIFTYIITISSLKSIFTISLTWFSFMFCLFLKCGVAPFFFWKPTFFKGINIQSLFIYICFYYYFLLVFFAYFILVYVNEIFYFNAPINYLLLVIGTIIFSFILCESYYIKSFVALSSILNTLFVFLSMSVSTSNDFFFIL